MAAIGAGIFYWIIQLEMRLDNRIAQGLQQDLLMLDFTASWHWHHNLFLEGFYLYRKETYPDAIGVGEADSHILGVGLRMNVGRRENLF